MAADGISPGDPFALPVAPASCLIRAACTAARPFLDRLLGLDDLRRLYSRVQTGEEIPFESRVLRALDVRVRVESAEAPIPETGPLIVAANHPTGALDGLAAAEVVREVRPDVRLLTNHLLRRIPELQESCFFVDPFGGASAASRSRGGLRAAHLWLKSGGALVMFPAGEVAWRTNEHGQRVESPWTPTLGRLAQATGARVLPMWLDGSNSSLFYAAGRIHPLLRTLRLGHEFLNKRGTTVRVYIGTPFTPDRLPGSVSDSVAAIRSAVDGLASSREGSASHPAVIEPAVPRSLLEADLNALAADRRLLTSGGYEVFCAEAASIPHVLREIGRLREITFRAVGEGTGRASDQDEFDRHYDHLFVWNRARAEIVGAYRVGATDRIVATHGTAGLYTTTLFRYDERMLDRLGPALELGRSFVRAEYQKNYSALLLLWKGIGRLVARSPRYRVLFGPVSISSRYQEASQQFLRRFLEQEHGNQSLASLVHAVNPPRPMAPPSRDSVVAADVDELDALIARIEGRQGIPVLLRQYLRLNATLLGFNIDPAFGDALDALMMVDLTKLPVETLQRYMGRDAAAFLQTHAQQSRPAA